MAHHPAPVSSCVWSPQGVLPLHQCCPSLGSEHWVKNGPSPQSLNLALKEHLEEIREGLKDLRLWAAFSKADGGCSDHLDISRSACQSHSATPLQQCRVQGWTPPNACVASGFRRAGVLCLLGIPASSLHLHLCPIWPPTLSPTSDPFASSFSALSWFPAMTLRKISSVALTPTLCFQDFRKYEEGFDPYSMVSENAPPPGESSQECGWGLQCAPSGPGGPRDEVGHMRSPQGAPPALFCEGSLQIAF